MKNNLKLNNNRKKKNENYSQISNTKAIGLMKYCCCDYKNC